MMEKVMVVKAHPHTSLGFMCCPPSEQSASVSFSLSLSPLWPADTHLLLTDYL